MSVLIVKWDDLDFAQAFNRGASARTMGLPVDAVILEGEDKIEWIKGWTYQDERAPKAPIFWRLDV